jgi:hypothetical protein
MERPNTVRRLVGPPQWHRNEQSFFVSGRLIGEGKLSIKVRCEQVGTDHPAS